MGAFGRLFSMRYAVPSSLTVLVTSLWSISCCEDDRQSHDSGAAVPQARLKQVHVIFRHGARTPLTEKYWNCKWDVCGKLFEAVPMEITDVHGNPQPPCERNEEQMEKKFEGGCAMGELTMAGQRQALQLGLWLRERYIELLPLLPQEYQPGTIAGRSTNFQRTLATLQGVLTGLYPANTTPIRVVTATYVEEILFANARACARLAVLLNAAKRAAKQGADDDAELRALEDKVRAAMGLDNEHRVAWTDLHDAMTAMSFHGKPLPRGMRDARLLDAINARATSRMVSIVAPMHPAPHSPDGAEIIRLSLGRLLEEVMSSMERVVQKHDDKHPKLLLYSGHDTTIMPLLVLLGVQFEKWPPYASNIVFELWESTEHQPSSNKPHTHFVRILYNGEPLAHRATGSQDSLDFAAFSAKVLGPYRLAHAKLAQHCAVDASKGSDAAQATKAQSVEGVTAGANVQGV